VIHAVSHWHALHNWASGSSVRLSPCPYLTEHIDRFGDYILNLDRKPPQPDYGYTRKSTAFGS
jgi:hypothetical protein